MTGSYLILVSFNHIGDYNQSLQIKRALLQANGNATQVNIVNVEDPSFGNFHISNQTKFIHSIGQKSILKIGSIMHQLNNKLLIIQIHQHFDQLKILKPHILIIPQINYKQCDQLKETYKILLHGTPFEKLTDQNLQELFEKSQISKDIDIGQNYIIVMLSGDAPDGCKMKFFTKQSADNLLLKLVYLLGKYEERQYTIIIQNGPRTGKHDPITLNQVCLHKFSTGSDPSLAVDPISKYFVEQVSKLNVPYKFYNFSFQIDGANKKINSFYRPLLFVGKRKNNLFLFPMQSVSMCSQLPFYIESNRLYAYFSSSTNQTHLKFVNEGFQKGFYNKFIGESLKVVKISSNKQSDFDDTKEIIEKIDKWVEKQKQLTIQSHPLSQKNQQKILKQQESIQINTN